MSKVQNYYNDYIKSPNWELLKLNKLDQNPLCEICSKKSFTVHHLSYDRLWKELESDIVSVCNSCHYDCHHINWIQIKNTSRDLLTRYNQLKSNFSDSWKKTTIEQENGNNFFREETLKSIKKDPSVLEKLPYTLRNDRQIVFEAIKYDGYYFRYASEELRNDKTFVLKLLENEGQYLEEYPFGFVLESLWNNLLKDELFLLELLESQDIRVSWRYILFSFLSDKYKNDKIFLLRLLKKGYISLNDIWNQFLSDRDIILEYVKNDDISWSWNRLSEISEELKNDIEIFTYVAKSLNPHHIRYASEEIKNNKEIALFALSKGWLFKTSQTISVLWDKIKDDNEIIYDVINKDPISFKHASERIRWEKQIALYAIDKDWKNIEYIAENLKDDAEILLEASYSKIKKIWTHLYYEWYNFDNAVKYMSTKFQKMTYWDVKKSLWNQEDNYWGLAWYIYKLFH